MPERSIKAIHSRSASCISAACAATLASNLALFPARQKRYSHGMSFGRYAGGMLSGPRGSASQCGTRASMPLWASGRMSENANAPALPELVSSQMPVRSITVTSCPASTRKAATQMPTMPPPMTAMSTASPPPAGDIRAADDGACLAPRLAPCSTSAMPLTSLPASSSVRGTCRADSLRTPAASGGLPARLSRSSPPKRAGHRKVAGEASARGRWSR